MTGPILPCFSFLSVGPALLLAVLLAAPVAAFVPFSDVTQEAGLVYLQHEPQPAGSCILGDVCPLSRMSGGAAVADVDGDGHPDLFVTRLDAHDLLFRNRGDGSFEDVSASAGFAGFLTQSNGAAFGDIDNDGDPDLMVTVVSAPGDPTNARNYLFVNDGQGHFSEEAVLRGADVDTGPGFRATWSVAFGDYDRDGWLDIHVTEWAPFFHSVLLRNRGDAEPGHFDDVTASAGLDFSEVDGFASTFVDLDGDGWQDLAVAADFGTSRLYWNERDGTFSDGTVASGVGTDENGMGSTLGDFDGDGDLDWFVTSIFDPEESCEVDNCNWGYTGNRLYRNEGGRLFSDATDAAGVREGFWGWGAAFFDYENDGDLDLVMTNGVDFPEAEIDEPWNEDPMRFWLNDGSGAMTEHSAQLDIDDTGSGKGLLTFDYDGDGDLDVFVVNNGSTPRLFRNEIGPWNDWIRIRVEGIGSNRDANGARVSVRATPTSPYQVREVGVASHFIGQSEEILHFGLGKAYGTVSRIEVYFPASGRRVVLEDVPARQLLVIDEFHGCGLLGIEVLLPLGLAAVVRGRRPRKGGSLGGYASR